MARKRKRQVAEEVANAAAGAAGGGVSPPMTNRGDETPIDYLSLTLHDSQLSKRLSVVAQELGLQGDAEVWFQECAFKPRGYTKLRLGPYGCAIKSGAHKGTHENFEGKGEFFSSFAAPEISGFLRLLVSMGSRYNVPRIDIKLDHCPFTPRQIYLAIKRGETRTRLRRESLKWIHSGDGDTVYLGNRQNLLIRCYNLRGFTRFELECRDAKTTARLEAFIGSEPATWDDLAVGFIREVVDFVERSDRPERAPLLPFWTEFVGEAEKRKTKSVAVAEPVLPFQAFAERVYGYHAPMVRMLSELTGEEIEEIVFTRQLSKRQHARLLTLKKELYEAIRWWQSRGKVLPPFPVPSFE